MTFFLFLFLTLLFIPQVFAKKVNKAEAKNVALNWYFENMNKGNVSLQKALNQLETYSLKEDSTGIQYAYIFNLKPKGFLIVAADDICIPIIFYSNESTYDENNVPPSFKWMLNKAKDELCNAIKNDIEESQSTKRLWQKYNVSPEIFLNIIKTESIGENILGPLLTTTWGQGWPYNEFCPSDSNGSGGHVLTGCVATAMAQIMKYHNYPKQGRGSHEYDHPQYGTVSADFETTTYNWNMMPNYISITNSEISTLMFHCGVATNMDYGTDGSATYTRIVPTALSLYFKYSHYTQNVIRGSSDSTSWTTSLIEELKNLRPVLYVGYDVSYKIGHAFVIDGYQGTDYFHCNWGWDGNADGYFYLNNLTPSGADFSYHQSEIIRIMIGIPDLYIDLTGWEAPAIGGTSRLIKVTNRGNEDTLNYDIATDVDWITTSKTVGKTPDEFTITALANNLDTTRIGHVLIHANANIEDSLKFITIIQFPGNQTTIVSTFPSQNSLNVSKSSDILMCFSDDIDASTLSNNTVKITGSQSGRNTGVFSYDTQLRTVIIDPHNDFKVGETVEVVATTGIKSLSGGMLYKLYKLTYKIKPEGGTSLLKESDKNMPSMTAYSFACSDFNGDGNVDLATTSYFTYNPGVSIWKNLGGNFIKKQYIIPYNRHDIFSINQVVSGDFDLDGDIDLALTVAKLDCTGILFFLNNENDNFAIESCVDIRVFTNGKMATGDWDGDGTLDLAVISQESPLVILKNNGSGVFSVASALNVGYNNCAIEKGDWNNDGNLDLAVTDNFAVGSSLTKVLMNDGYGHFNTQQILNLNGSYVCLAKDFDGDGDIDFVAPNAYHNYLSVLKNNGKGIFSETSRITGLRDPDVSSTTKFTGAVSGDLDADGDLDLVVAYGNSWEQLGNEIFILLNDGNGNFLKFFNIFTQYPPSALTLGDFDNDLDLDLVVSTYLGYGITSIFKNINKLALPSIPVLFSPENGAAISSKKQTFRWRESSGPSWYTFQMSDISDFSSRIVDISWLPDTSYIFELPDENKTYYWRVNAFNIMGTSDWSEVWSFAMPESKWRTYNVSNSGLPYNSINSLTTDQERNVWIGDNHGGVTKFDGTQWIKYGHSDIGSTERTWIDAIEIDGAGNKWIGCNGIKNSLAKYDGNNWTIYNLPIPGTIHSLAIDIYGNKWIGTHWRDTPDDGGLLKFDGQNWTIYNKSNTPLPVNVVWTVAIDEQENKWIGTPFGLLKFDGTNWTLYNSLPSNDVRAIVIDEAGNKWIGTYGGGLVKFNGTNWVVYNSSNSGLLYDKICLINIDEYGNKWLTDNIYSSANVGLTKFNGTTWTHYNDLNSNLPSNKLTALAIDIENNLWIGTEDAGLAVYCQEKMEFVTVKYAFPQQGWYLVSLPVEPEDKSLTGLFPTAPEAFSWDVDNQNYVSSDVLKPEIGYWLAIPDSVTNLVKGISFESYSKPCKMGWNLLGSILDTLEVSSITSNPIGSILAVFSWDANKNKYLPVDKIFPKNGYWFAISQDCEIVINSSKSNLAIKKSKLSGLTESFVNLFGNNPPPPPQSFSSVFADKLLPSNFSLNQNYPNPFNPATIIKYQLPMLSNVELIIYNIMGQKVITLVNEKQTAGFYQVKWKGLNSLGNQVSTGIYFYKLQAENFKDIKKMVFIR